MKKLILLFFTVLLILPAAFPQPDSCQTKISLLTCSPGTELYSTFGHTAIRVQHAGSDEIFNYGTFEFGPDFYSKFIRGKLLYFLSVENYEDFIYLYQMESRSIREQVLILSCNEKEKLYAALKENAQPQNRNYKYDFLFDNCTTRARDIIASSTSAPVNFKNILPEQIPTFRNLIHSYLDAGHQHWSKLGIDILLGAKLDRKVTNTEAMFLPDYLLKGMDSAFITDHPLVSPPVTILELPSLLEDHSIFTPMVVFSCLLLLIAALTYFKGKWAQTILGIFDFLFFFILGLAGLLLLFMWFGTDHKTTVNNYNLLWALPSDAVMAFYVHSKKAWVKKYFRIICYLTLALALTWFLLPQQMNKALLPILLLIMFRSWQISKTEFYAGKKNYP